SCDVGTLPNQTYPNSATPIAATEGGDPKANGYLSYLAGQRLCMRSYLNQVEGTTDFLQPLVLVLENRTLAHEIGRNICWPCSPEIDALEATVTDGIGYVSLSAQFAPFNAKYSIVKDNTTTAFDDPERTVLNPYRGSVSLPTNGKWIGTDKPRLLRDTRNVLRAVWFRISTRVNGTTKSYYLYDLISSPFDNAYITWINEVRAWTLYSSALVADSSVEIGRRSIPQEPMYLITNLGISESFGTIDTTNLKFPVTMLVDYIRVYQRKTKSTSAAAQTDSLPRITSTPTWKLTQTLT
ncbi:beta-glucan synthesis-associated, partial [Pholiota molesta]